MILQNWEARHEMIKDLEGHRIHLTKEGNGHMLVLGNSGQGKTYFLCRMLEKYCEERKKVLILDFSGSYSQTELHEKKFKYPERVRRYNLTNGKFCWMYRASSQEMVAGDLNDALLCCLHINSYFQKKLLFDAVIKVLRKSDGLIFPLLIDEIVDMLEKEDIEETVAGNRDNLGRILTRLSPFEYVKSLKISRKNTTGEVSDPIVILDLSGFPDSQRKFLTEFLLCLLWKELYRADFPNRCDILVLDEMQFLSLKEGSTLATIMRECRKRKLEVVLSTQFIGNYDKSELRALQQVDHTVIFRPTPEEYKKTTQMISLENIKAWERIVRELKRGEAILKGFYTLDNQSKVLNAPILLEIE